MSVPIKLEFNVQDIISNRFITDIVNYASCFDVIKSSKFTQIVRLIRVHNTQNIDWIMDFVTIMAEAMCAQATLW
jgi:hypothetical protein